MTNEKKVFDDYNSVDCNQCESWWNNQCDGVTEGSQKRCTAFVAVRRVNIPLEIERLRSALKWLISGMIVLGVWFIVLMGMVLFG